MFWLQVMRVSDLKENEIFWKIVLQTGNFEMFPLPLGPKSEERYW